MLKGCIIEENLIDNRLMNQFKVIGLNISSHEDPLKDGIFILF